MKHNIEKWLLSRLGILIDLSPDNFGKHIKDGTILAKLLYSYGAIPLQIFNTIKPTKNVNECYSNLLRLKPWLEYVDTRVKDEVLYEIACGQGSTALHLFYALYLNLNYKDNLTYLSKQKEQKYCQEYIKRDVEVLWKPDKDFQPVKDTCDSKFTLPIIQKRYIINRHRQKCNEILDKIRQTRENYAARVKEATKDLGPIISRHASSKKLSANDLEIKNTFNDMNCFEEKFGTEMPDLSYKELVELQDHVRSMPQNVPDLNEARGYMNNLKQNARMGVVTEGYQRKTQDKLCNDLWHNLKKKHGDNFDELVCRNLLKQSQYEKQMVSKLYYLRQKRDLLVNNRRVIENLYLNKIMQREYDDCINYRNEAIAEEIDSVEFEKQRLLELHKRVYINKVRSKFMERLEEAKSILDKLIDIAIRISEFRAAFSCEMPRSLMKDLKELFFKDLPIFDILDDVTKLYEQPICEKNKVVEEDFGEAEEFGEEEFGEDGSEEPIEEGEDELCDESGEVNAGRTAEFLRQEVLNECDFNDYLHLLGSWMVEILMPDLTESEVNESVLGYIVHKMLACKYPVLTVHFPADIKTMTVRGVVQGPNDDLAFTMLSDLLALRKILLVRVDDAISFVLTAYKSEMDTDLDPDLMFQNNTKSSVKGRTGNDRAKESISTRKGMLLKTESASQKRVSSDESSTKDVAIQTPRHIPEDDPLLSSNADIGRSVFESLGLGEPVPDTTVIAAIIAYVISQQDHYAGWVLWNYPLLASQASKLEHTLTGQMLFDPDDLTETVDVIEGFPSRSSCVSKCEDDFADKRKSRLVPKPETDEKPKKLESYFTSFVRVRRKSGESLRQSILTEPTKSQDRVRDHIEKFYSEQNIFMFIGYSQMNFQVMKDVAKAILGEFKSASDYKLEQKSSKEIFGSDVVALNEKYNPGKKKSEKESKIFMQFFGAGKTDTEPVSEVEGEVEVESVVSSVKKASAALSRNPVPGDPNWEWATGEISEDMQLSLATFWENLETVFIEDFKYIFFCLRVHRANVVKYEACLKQILQTFMRREDEKQDILSEFQRKFNEIDDDLRPDFDVKCELYVRVSELEETLMQIADERQERSDKYKTKIIKDNWVADELVFLVNLYSRAMQLEANRAIDTCQFINDYYLSLLQKSPPENVFQKPSVPLLVANYRNYSLISARSTSLSNDGQPSHSAVDKESRVSIRRSKHDKRVDVPSQRDGTRLSGGTEAIYSILMKLDFNSQESTPYHKFFLANVDELTQNVRNVYDHGVTTLRKGSIKGTAATKDKKKTSEIKIENNSKLYEEWNVALDNELHRFLYRTKLIQARAIQDFNEFIYGILNTLSLLTGEIGDIYNKEIFSISECCKIFRCAIEEETAVQPRLELNVDEFTINTGCLLFPKPSVTLTTVSDNIINGNDFTIEQLTSLLEKLNYIVADGNIIRRAFIYILEDLRVLKSEDGNPKLLPDIWDELNPDDLPILLNKMFKNTEVINWKDFLIYALNLLPPTDLEILNMRSSFRAMDPSGTELVSYKNFMNVDLWFQDHYTRFDTKKLKEFLFKLYQVGQDSMNYYAFLLGFCKDDDSKVGFMKALSLTSGKRIVMDLYQDFLHEEGEEEEMGMEEETSRLSSESEKSFKSKKKKHCGTKQCLCKLASVSSPEEYTEEELGEAYLLYIKDDESQPSFHTSDVSCATVKKVILTSFNILNQLTILLPTKDVFEQVIDSTLHKISQGEPVLRVSKLFRENTISLLLERSGKFKMWNLHEMVEAIIADRRGSLIKCRPPNCA